MDARARVAALVTAAVLALTVGFSPAQADETPDVAGHFHSDVDDGPAPDWTTWGTPGDAHDHGDDQGETQGDDHGEDHGVETERPRALVLGGFGVANALILGAAALSRRRQPARLRHTRRSRR